MNPSYHHNSVDIFISDEQVNVTQPPDYKSNLNQSIDYNLNRNNNNNFFSKKVNEDKTVGNIIRNGNAIPSKGPARLALFFFGFIIFLIGTFQSLLIGMILTICMIFFILALAMIKWILLQDSGTLEMNNIASAIHEGSDSFFKRIYGTIFHLSIPLSIILWIIFFLRKPSDSHKYISILGVATLTSFSFLFGAGCSALAGYISLWVSVRTNIRVASMARISDSSTLQLALRAGGVVGLILVCMVVVGISLLFSFFCLIYEGQNITSGMIDISRIPFLLVGFGFGASFVAIFSQLGGGIFTKAADVGADLVGKNEQNIPEDDPRNPAVIADLVGDNVGDCSARGADLFESISAEIISTMILAGSLSMHCGLPHNEKRRFILFPLLIHAFDLIVSSLGIFSIPAQRRRGLKEEPLDTIKRGYKVSVVADLIFFFIAAYTMLSTEVAPNAWFHYFLCGVVGIISAYAQILVTQYYTDSNHRPVKNIAEASVSGHATNVITGLSVGMESVFIPSIIMSISILASYYLGQTSGLVDENHHKVGGIFGTAVGTMGMLSTAVYILAMDVFGPITDNAGGIVEMSGQPSSVREITDSLDSVGNTTKATTKGYAIGSAALASFLLFRAFIDEVSDYSGLLFEHVDIAKPEIFIGGFLGSAMVWIFASLAIEAVGSSAQAVVHEVRRQFQSIPGILDGSARPHYGVCCRRCI